MYLRQSHHHTNQQTVSKLIPKLEKEIEYNHQLTKNNGKNKLNKQITSKVVKSKHASVTESKEKILYFLLERNILVI